MKIEINNINSEIIEKKEAIYYYDINGNIYLNIKNDYFYLDINNINNLEWIKILNLNNLINCDKKIKYDNLVSIKETDLKNKIIEEIEKEKDDDEIEDNENDEEYDNNYKTHFKMLPEDKKFFIENNMDEKQNLIIGKNKEDDSFEIDIFNKAMDTNANYDVLVADGDKILFSLISKDRNSYRIKLSKNIIELNIIGSEIKTFEPYYDIQNNEIELIMKQCNQKCIIL